jgi:hypothetical protein
MSFNIDVSNDVLANADLLKNSNVQKRLITNNVIDILRKINEDLHTAQRAGQHKIITEIPIVFDIPNMSNADAQRAIWSNIIEALKTKNYRIAICPAQKSCKLRITWLSEDDEQTIKYQLQILADHTQQF